MIGKYNDISIYRCNRNCMKINNEKYLIAYENIFMYKSIKNTSISKIIEYVQSHPSSEQAQKTT